jgi:hypothetical protein
MRRGYLDRSQGLRVEPVVSVTEAKAIDRADLPIDNGELKLTIERRRFDVSPSRRIENPG